MDNALNQPVFAAFQACALRHASRPAVIAPDLGLTYSDLAAAAGRVHAALACGGVRPGQGVGLLFQAAADQIAAMLGVLRAGAYYVMLDPEFAEARLGAIVEDGAIDVLLVEPALAAVARRLAAARITSLVHDPRALAVTAPPVPVLTGADELAYVAYTSGSTGRPKGVMQPQRNIWHEIEVHRDALALGPEDRSGLLYSPSVVGSVRDIFGMLLNGGALCPFPFKRRGLPALVEWLRTQRITQLHAVPLLFREIARALSDDRTGLDTVRVVFVAGDQVTPGDVALFRRKFSPAARFYTGIGASETSSIYTHWLVDEPMPPEAALLPTGIPVPGKEVLLVDENRQVLPPGSEGEIAVRSRYLAAGYWRRPELTARVFVTADEGGGERIYYTGDYGRFDSAGRLLHLGRLDQQVKINGERIELGAVAQALRAQGSVRQAFVRVQVQAGAAPRLIAYVAAAAEVFDPPALRAALAQSFSAAAIPAFIIRVDTLPLTDNGKVDVQALPDPTPVTGDLMEIVRAWSLPEQILVPFWRECFPHAEPEALRTATLAELGGDSLQAVNLSLLVREKTGLVWPAHLPLDRLTLADLAREFGRPRPATGDGVEEIRALAAHWKLEQFGRQVAPNLPVFLCGEDRPGTPLLWLGQAGMGLALALALARVRPVYLVPVYFSTSLGSPGINPGVYMRLAELWAPHAPPRLLAGAVVRAGSPPVTWLASCLSMAKRCPGCACWMPAAPRRPCGGFSGFLCSTPGRVCCVREKLCRWAE